MQTKPPAPPSHTRRSEPPGWQGSDQQQPAAGIPLGTGRQTEQAKRRAGSEGREKPRPPIPTPLGAGGGEGGGGGSKQTNEPPQRPSYCCGQVTHLRALPIEVDPRPQHTQPPPSQTPCPTPRTPPGSATPPPTSRVFRPFSFPNGYFVIRPMFFSCSSTDI